MSGTEYAKFALLLIARVLVEIAQGGIQTPFDLLLFLMLSGGRASFLG